MSEWDCRQVPGEHFISIGVRAEHENSTVHSSWTERDFFERVGAIALGRVERPEAGMGLGAMMFWMALAGIVCGLASYKTAKWAAVVVAMASCVGARHVYATFALAAGDSWWSWLAKGIGGLWGFVACLLGFAAAGGLWFYARMREKMAKENS